MQSMLEIPQVGIDPDVFVSHVVAVCISNTGQIRCVGDPEPVSLPGEALDGIESSSELLPGIGDAIIVRVLKDPDRVGRRIRSRRTILGSHAYARTSPRVKGEGTGISYDRLLGEEGDLEVFRDDGEILRYGTKVAHDAEGGGKGNGERGYEGCWDSRF